MEHLGTTLTTKPAAAVPRESARVFFLGGDQGFAIKLSAEISRSSPLRPGLMTADAVAMAATLRGRRGDVLVLDESAGRAETLRRCASARAGQPDLRVLWLTSGMEFDAITESLGHGADGILLKHEGPANVVIAIHELLAGGAPFSRPFSRAMVEHFQSRGQSPSEGARALLTRREDQVLQLLARGCLYKEIAAGLGISLETVRYHLQNAYAKLQARSRTEAVVKFLRHQLPG